jgi:hypothetical protein
MSVVINGSAGVTTNSGAVYNGIASGTAVASTSGTSIDFTSIPSWVKRITVMLSGVSTSGTSIFQIQLGSGSFTTSGYNGNISNGASNTAFTNGFLLSQVAPAAAETNNANMVVNNVTGNTWSEFSIFGSNSGSKGAYGCGTLALGGTLDRIRITTVNGTDTFDAGTINILYE